MGACTVLALFVVAWLLFGTIEVSIEVPGVLMREGGDAVIAADFEGRVAELHLGAGERVESGQTVATLLTLSGKPGVPVLSTLTGRILEVSVAEGSRVEAGAVLYRVERVDRELVAVLFLTPEQVGEVREGMRARVSPDVVTSDIYGVIPGAIRSSPGTPQSEEGLVALVGQGRMAEDLYLAGATSPVSVDLERDGSSLVWTAGSRPAVDVGIGTCRAVIVVRRYRPIRFVLPRVSE